MRPTADWLERAHKYVPPEQRQRLRQLERWMAEWNTIAEKRSRWRRDTPSGRMFDRHKEWEVEMAALRGRIMVETVRLNEAMPPDLAGMFERESPMVKRG